MCQYTFQYKKLMFFFIDFRLTYILYIILKHLIRLEQYIYSNEL